jgi:hypothetical protein
MINLPVFAAYTRRRFGLLLLLLLPFLVACEDTGMAELAAEMAVEWAEEKKLVSVDASGDLSINYVQIAKYEAARWWDGTTGDSQVDAALDVGPIAKSMRDADNLAEAGMAERDPAKLDDAIALRPQDWSYRDQKAAVLAAQGDEEGARDAILESEALVQQRIENGGNCRGLKQNMLRNREAALSRQLQDDPENQTLMTLLMDTQDQLYSLQNGLPNSPCL